jgi:peptide/nickel transport system permease protein
MAVAASRIDIPPDAGRVRAALLREVVRRPAGAFGLLVIALLLVLVAFAQWIAPYDAAAQDIPARLQGPTLAHPFGTDQLGRDILSRIIFGTRVELSVALPSVAAALLAGLVLGLVAGYLGGRVDTALVILMDSVQAFPAIILALTLLVLLGPSLASLVVVIAVAFTPQFARVTRASVLALKQNVFVEAERALGASPPRIVLVHIAPNVLPPLFVLLAMNIPSAITTEAGLSFLGVGVQPPTPSWGVILADGFSRVRDSPSAVVFTGLALMITTLGFTLLGETIRDAIDPRLSGALVALRSARRKRRRR